MPSDDDHTLLRRPGDPAAQTNNNPQFALLSSEASVRCHRHSKPAAAGVLTQVFGSGSRARPRPSRSSLGAGRHEQRSVAL